MSQITRCPACGTMFKVVPDQLRISDGWVRCGHCAEVFDAAAQLQALPSAMVPAPAAPDAPVKPVPGEVDDGVARPPAGDAREPADDSGAGPEALAVPPPPEPEAAPAAEPEEPLDDANASSTPPPEGPVTAQPQESARAEALVPAEAEAQAEPAAPPEAPVLPDLSFVRDARRQAYWRQPRMRAALALAGAALAVALALQVVVHERDRIAAFAPGARPGLEALCAPLQCVVLPLRQIESIVIDSSSFNKLRGDTYQLNLTIRNTSAATIAMPGIELALTDAQDQPVLRRVLLPADLAAPAVLAPGAEWLGSLPLSVTPDGSAARIAGYRVLAFYP